MNLMQKYRARMTDPRYGINDMTASLTELNKEDRVLFEERAAIMEFDGGLTRKEAEQQAARCYNGRGGTD